MIAYCLQPQTANNSEIFKTDQEFMAPELRRVEFKTREWVRNPEGPAKPKDTTRTGKFHGWGAECYEADGGGYVSGSVAIIEEDGSGQVYAIEPKHVKFIL